MTKNRQKTDHSIAIYSIFFLKVWYILDASRWILTSRRFILCVAKGGRGGFRPSYGRPKFTLFKKKRILAIKKSPNPKIFGIEPHHAKLVYGKKWFAWWGSISMIVGVGLFFAAYNFANGLHLVALTRLWATETGSKIFLQIFKIIFGILIA